MKKLFFLIVIVSLFQPIFSQSDQDRDAIEQLLKTMADSWTAGDGQKFASVFADQHDFIVWNGFYFKNTSREMNAKNHQGIFNSIYLNTQHFNKLDKIKFIREDLALIHVLAAVVKQGEERPKDPHVLWSGLLEKTKGDWKIIAFHNLDLEVFENEQMRNNAPMPPEVMYASWYEQK